MRRLVALLVLLAGCSTVELDARWHPLKYVVQSKTMALGTGQRVVNDTMFVSDIDDWFDSHPEPLLSAALTHERVHSIRQRKFSSGYLGWIAKYLVDLDFMLFEEQLGFYYQISYLRSHGAQIVIDSWARVMSKYFNASGQMITKEDAKEWLQKVVNGQWKPPPGVLPF